MPLPSLHRLLSSFLPSTLPGASLARAETCPPLPWPHRSAWMPRLGFERSRRERLAAARLDFCQAIDDLRTPAALDTQTRIAVARSLHELWHFREQVFSLVARRHDQAEAGRRLAELDCHFSRRPRRANSTPANPLPGHGRAA